VEIEAFEVRLARPAGGDPGGVGLAADLDDAGAGPRPERDAPLHGRAADAGQRGRFLGNRIDVGRVLGRSPRRASSRSTRRRIVARSRATSSSLGGSAG